MPLHSDATSPTSTISAVSTINEVLEFWLGPGDERDAPAAEIKKRWFTKDPAFDRELEERFGQTLAKASSGDLDSWAATPSGNLVLVIVLDQFTRNIHRDRPAMFRNDGKALVLAERALSARQDRDLKLGERQFLYMPLMHAEDLERQDHCIALFQDLAEQDQRYSNNVDFAIRHREIIARFGRFPHRNGILGRTSTAEELEFLRSPGSSF